MGLPGSCFTSGFHSNSPHILLEQCFIWPSLLSRPSHPRWLGGLFPTVVVLFIRISLNKPPFTPNVKDSCVLLFHLGCGLSGGINIDCPCNDCVEHDMEATHHRICQLVSGTCTDICHPRKDLYLWATLSLWLAFPGLFFLHFAQLVCRNRQFLQRWYGSHTWQMG